MKMIKGCMKLLEDDVSCLNVLKCVLKYEYVLFREIQDALNMDKNVLRTCIKQLMMFGLLYNVYEEEIFDDLYCHHEISMLGRYCLNRIVRGD